MSNPLLLGQQGQPIGTEVDLDPQEVRRPIPYKSKYNYPLCHRQRQNWEYYLMGDSILHGFGGRRRLIFIQRDFKPNGDQYSALLTAADYSSPKFIANETFSNGPLPTYEVKWNGFGTHFFTDYRMKRMLEVNQESANIQPNDMNLKPNNFRPFSVIISSLRFVPKRKVGQDGVSLAFLTIIRHVFSKRLSRFMKHPGQHVFISRNGDIYSVFTYMNDQVYKGRPVKKYLIGAPAIIGSIYPVYRCEWEEWTEQTPDNLSLCFGLCYKRYTPDGTQIYSDYGDRYYHRFGAQRLTVGGVYELTEDQLQLFHQEQTNNQADNFVAFYVCVGAKLVVLDEYHLNEVSRSHNRALVQQGGIVICRADLKVALPVHLMDPALLSESCPLHLRLFQWQDFWPHLKRIENDNFAQLGNIQNPVIFLGATNSKYNSIAWCLSIQTIQDNGIFSRQIVLFTPEGARITAIADGLQGLDEIRHRRQYEILHDSVLSPVDTPFVLPDAGVVQSILNINDSRSFYIDDVWFNGLVQTREYTRLAHEFNITTVLQYNAFFNNQSQQTRQTTRLAVPPMYPPFFGKHGTQNATWSIPCKEKYIENMDSIYKYPDDKDSSYLEINLLGRNCIQKDSTQWAYHFIRLKEEEEQNYANLSGFCPKAGAQDDFYRLGVDGWMWKKASNDTVIKEFDVFFR